MHSGQVGTIDEDISQQRRSTLRLAVAAVAMPAWLQGCSSAGDAQGDAEGLIGKESLAVGGAEEGKGFRARLYTPTFIEKLNGRYFIVDCWHHRIIHASDLNTPLVRWQALDEDIAGPHSIATDGVLYVAEDTGRHGLHAYRETARGRFERVQEVSGVGVRPHRTLFDARHQQFLVVGSGDQSIHLLENRDGTLVRTLEKRIPELGTQYCRSITLHQGLLHFVGNEDIVIYRVERGSVSATGQVIHLPQNYQGSNDIFFLGSRHGIFTSTPQKAFLFSSLDELANGTAQDVSAAFRGTPYSVSRFDGRLWIPEITEYSAIRSYPAGGDSISQASARTLFDFGEPDSQSIERKRQIPT